MGTSTSQPSPKTKQWQQARAQYQRRGAVARDVVAAVAQAIDPGFETAMAAEPVARCIDVLLRTATEVRLDETISALLAAYRAREAARQELAGQPATSRQAEAALDAVFLTALAQAEEGGARPVDRTKAAASQPILAQQFMAHYVAGIFAHLISRDSSDFIGSESLPTVSDRADLAADSERVCVDAVYASDLGPLIHAVTQTADRPTLICAALAPVVADILARLRKGGHPQ